MVKREKAIILLLLMFSACFLCFYKLMMPKSPVQNELQYPTGNLSTSLFVQQNSNYSKEDYLTEKCAISGMPYYVDLPSGSMAAVGNGQILQVSEDAYIFLSSFGESEKPKDVILKEFPAALLLDYNPDYCFLQELKEETGYINGFQAEYLFASLSVSNGKDIQSVYMAAYSLSDSNNDISQKILVGVMTTKEENSAFTGIKVLLDGVTNSLRYDEKLDRMQEEERRKETMRQKEEMGAENIENTEESIGFAVDEIKEDRSHTTEYYSSYINPEDVDVRITPIKIERDFEDLFINVVAQNVVVGSEIVLIDPNGNFFQKKNVSEDGLTTQFQIGSIGPEQYGSYLLKITHYGEYLGIAVRLGDAAQGNVLSD